MALRQEWRAFLSRGRTIALIVAMAVVVLSGLLFAFSNRSTCSRETVEVACPADPRGPLGEAVSDTFYFGHRSLTGDGGITVRMTSMTGTITYPPPDHDEIVPGLVPWAKTGIMIKDGVTQGSSYAALMLTGANGVRMQSDYVHDTAGSPGGVSPQAPRWLRLTRSGDTVTGYESPDGAHWTQVGTAVLTGVAETVQIGLFATSPGDLTLRPTGLGGSSSEVRFTQASATFDNVTPTGVAEAGWRADAVGEMGGTEWEREHQAPGLVTADGTFTVTGSGDIGPIGTAPGFDVTDTLIGLVLGLVVVIVVAARFRRPGVEVSAARSVVLGGATFMTGLVMAGVALPVGVAFMRANGGTVRPMSTLDELGIIVGVAGLIAFAALFTFALGALFRRAWAASLVAIAAIVIPSVLTAFPLLPDTLADWLLSLTPAAGFAVLRAKHEYPQVVAHYSPSEGYFPLPGWAGLAVLGGYAAVLLAFAFFRQRRCRVSAATL
ncbi:hypothetical protein [Amycolatopsis speibonae]|uniref:DUF1349 domain-containing protein n=1 Tax=Amycolatopsis speibonae TaxID=1450224 RepID=A0ABV7P4Z1_9PSEU